MTEVKINTAGQRKQEWAEGTLVLMSNQLHLTRYMHLQLQSMSSKANHSRFIYNSHSSSYLLFTQQPVWSIHTTSDTPWHRVWAIASSWTYLHHAGVLWITVHHVIKRREKVPQGLHEVGLSFVLVEPGRRWSPELHWQMITRLLFVSSLCKQPRTQWKWQEFDAFLLNH